MEVPEEALMSHPLKDVEARYSKAELPSFEVGDHVSVAVQIREVQQSKKGEEIKTRVQNFVGDVIAIQGKGIGRSFTVRRVVQGEGIERVFPFHSPVVKDVTVMRKGVVRRAKLYDLRKKSGKAARIQERRVHSGNKASTKSAAKPATEPAKQDAPQEES
jgi:large subunit ribosomal protein L19